MLAYRPAFPRLGEGAFGAVYIMRERETNTTYAAKVIQYHSSLDPVKDHYTNVISSGCRPHHQRSSKPGLSFTGCGEERQTASKKGDGSTDDVKRSLEIYFSC